MCVLCIRFLLQPFFTNTYIGSIESQIATLQHFVDFLYFNCWVFEAKMPALQAYSE